MIASFRCSQLAASRRIQSIAQPKAFGLKYNPGSISPISKAALKFSTTPSANSQASTPAKPPTKSKEEKKEVVNVVFVDKDGKRTPVAGHVGESILHVAHENNVELEGACEGSLACSTCHVILTPDYYKKLAEPTDEENDMLDLAFGLTDTSRLGCQIILRKDLEGMTLQLPAATRNMAVDGFKPKPH